MSLAHLAERGVREAGLAQEQRSIWTLYYAIAGGRLEEVRKGVRRARLRSCKRRLIRAPSRWVGEKDSTELGHEVRL